MPKITKVLKKISGELEELTVFYNQGNKFFIKEDRIRKVLYPFGFTPYGYESQRELINALDEAIIDLHKAQEESRKVIQIDVSAGRMATSNVRASEFGGRSWSPKGGKWDKIQTIPEEDYALAVSYCVLFERNDGNEIRYNHILNDGTIGGNCHINRPERFIWIDWSQEAEDFLGGLCQAIEALAEKFADFFSREDLVERLAAGLGNNLLGSGSQEDEGKGVDTDRLYERLDQINERLLALAELEDESPYKDQKEVSRLVKERIDIENKINAIVCPG